MNKKIIITLCFVLVISLIICLIIGLLKEKEQNNTNLDEEMATENLKLLEIDTPYGSLYYPDKWKKEMCYKIKENDNVVISFYGKIEGEKEIQLFDIIFNGKDGNFLGYLEETSVHICFYELDIENIDEKNKNKIIEMSESATVLINELEKMKNFSYYKKSNLEGEIKIKTKYGTIYYPKKWEENLKYVVNEQRGYSVIFYAVIEGKENIRLFELSFGDCEEEAIGKLNNDIKLYVHTYNLKNEKKWSEEELNIYHGMQEDVNYIINRLEQEGTLQREL